MSDEITILILIDGLRGDFDSFYGEDVCPTLCQLAKNGTRARRVDATFNTMSLPNHMSIATGVHPDKHGFVGNVMFDPIMDDVWYSFGNVGKGLQRFICHLDVEKAIWWWKNGIQDEKVEPIWTANERNGGTSAVYAWTLLDIPFSDILPTHQSKHNCENLYEVPYNERMDHVVDWLTLEKKAPNFVAIYVREVDEDCHTFGAKSEQALETLKGKLINCLFEYSICFASFSAVDDSLAHLKAALESKGLWDRTNLVITADHGHCDIDRKKIVYIEDYVDKERFVWKNPNFWPLSCSVDDLYEKLSKMPHCKVYRKEELVEQRYSDHWRIGPLVVIPDEGAELLRSHKPDGERFKLRSTHGYDFRLESMRPIFVATGPKFKQNFELSVEEPISLVDVASIAAKCMNFKLQTTDGEPERYEKLFK